MVSAQAVVNNMVRPRLPSGGVAVKADGLLQRRGSVAFAGFDNPLRPRIEVIRSGSLYHSCPRLVDQGATHVIVRGSSSPLARASSTVLIKCFFINFVVSKL